MPRHNAYHNFPNHNVPFFPLAGPQTRGVALITPGSNRSEYATGRDGSPRRYLEIAGEQTRHTVEIKSLEGARLARAPNGVISVLPLSPPSPSRPCVSSTGQLLARSCAVVLSSRTITGAITDYPFFTTSRRRAQSFFRRANASGTVHDSRRGASDSEICTKKMRGERVPVDSVDRTSRLRIHKSSTIHLVLRAATLDFFDRDLVRCPMPQVDEEKAALSGICSLALDRALVRAIHASSYIRTHVRTPRRKITHTLAPGTIHTHAL
ncbi:hypothetical protein DBV15_05699 [Temnothorax longispinosus]|uniref:Uncharacterized protein n=1 Tax=Temnothorax longispinosus TaxID=300112 RepID=A0A4S2JA34_9HYME|nr:hypothetical protein DBV15_05699 [Temnothorax longispinosus]